MAQPWGLLILFTLAIVLLCVWGGVMTALQALRPPRKMFAWSLATGRPKDPSELGLRFDEVEYSSGQRHPCPAWRIAGEATDSDAPIVVIVHGWGRSRWDSLTRVEPFRKVCSEIVLLDLPAHGEHAGAWSGVGTSEPQCVLHALREIAQQFPKRALILAGHSMGAGIAIRAANLCNNELDCGTAPMAVEKLNDMSAQSRQHSPQNVNPNGQGNQNANQHANQHANRNATHSMCIAGVIAFAPYSTLRSPIPARLALQNLPAWLFAPIAFLMLRMLGRMDRPLEIDSRILRAPLLVLAGEQDPISPLAHARAICSAAARGTLVVLAYQRHDDLRAGDAERFDRALADFLRAITEPLVATRES